MWLKNYNNFFSEYETELDIFSGRFSNPFDGIVPIKKTLILI